MTSLPKIQKIGKTRFILVKGEKHLLNDIFELVGKTQKRKPTKLTKSVLVKFLKLNKCIDRASKPTPKKKPEKKPAEEKLLKLGKENVKLQKKIIKEDKKDDKKQEKDMKKLKEEIFREFEGMLGEALKGQDKLKTKLKKLDKNDDSFYGELKKINKEFREIVKRDEDLKEMGEFEEEERRRMLENLVGIEKKVDKIAEGKGQVGSGVVQKIKDWIKTAYHMYTPMGRRTLGLGKGFQDKLIEAPFSLSSKKQVILNELERIERKNPNREDALFHMDKVIDKIKAIFPDQPPYVINRLVNYVRKYKVRTERRHLARQLGMYDEYMREMGDEDISDEFTPPETQSSASDMDEESDEEIEGGEAKKKRRAWDEFIPEQEEYLELRRYIKFLEKHKEDRKNKGKRTDKIDEEIEKKKKRLNELEKIVGKIPESVRPRRRTATDPMRRTRGRRRKGRGEEEQDGGKSTWKWYDEKDVYKRGEGLKKTLKKIGKTVGKAVKEGAKFAKKHKLVSKALDVASVVQPELAEVLQPLKMASSALGYGNHVQSVIFDKNIWTEKKAKKYLRSKSLAPIKPVHITDGYLRYRIRDPKQFTKFASFSTDDAGVKQIRGQGEISELSDGIPQKTWAKISKANRQNKTNFMADDEGKRLSLKQLKEKYDESYQNRLEFHKMFKSFVPKPKEPNLNPDALPDDSPKLERQNGDIVAESEQTPTEQPQVMPAPVLEGNGIEQGALTNFDIEKIMARDKSFRGAIPYDKMPYIHLGKGNNSFIINTDDSSGSGKHWIAVYIDRDNKRVEFFDPFGERPEHYRLMRPMKEFIRNRLDDGFYKLKWSTVKNQDPASDGCGLHAIRYIMDRNSGKNFKKASGFLKSIPRNEDKISQMREKYKYIV